MHSNNHESQVLLKAPEIHTSKNSDPYRSINLIIIICQSKRISLRVNISCLKKKTDTVVPLINLQISIYEMLE